MTVIDTSAVVDFLVGEEASEDVGGLLAREGTLAAPDLLVFEVLAVFRRHVQRGSIPPARARAAIEDLGDLAVEIFPTLPLRERAWELRENLTAADALLVALAERLGEPLATKDAALASAARTHTGIETIQLPGGP
ncbi:MAG: type II toxin-antitoxin system VapC family toxin [Actinomycetota bacterium]|nr:type II toxin-antitoxin system VapC family toxin [Actinomycetota bacterium]